jgi:hypothetical protein
VQTDQRWTIRLLQFQTLLSGLLYGVSPVGEYGRAWLLNALVGSLLLALGLRRWPRVFRWLTPVVVLVPVSFNVAALAALRLPLSSVTGQVALVGGLWTLSLSGLLFYAKESVPRRRVLVGVAEVAMLLQVLFASIQASQRERHQRDVAAMQRRLEAALSGNLEKRVRSVPSGALDFDRAWRAASGDAQRQATLVSSEIDLRLAPCRATRAPLQAWRQQDGKTAKALFGLVVDGLKQCDDSGVDVDALEYLLLSLYWPVP